MSLVAREDEFSRFWAVLRWGVALLVVAIAHAGAGWWMLTQTGATAEPPASVQGVTIDLEPVTAQERGPSQSIAASEGPAPEPEIPASPVPEATPAVVPPSPSSTLPALAPTALAQTAEPALLPSEAPPAQAAPAEPETMQAAEQAPPSEQPQSPPMALQPAQPPLADIPVPPLPPQETKSDAVLAQPAASPAAPMPLSRRSVLPPPDPRVLARQAAARKALTERKAQERAARAEAQAQRRASVEAAREQAGGGQATQTSAASSASSGASISTWRGEVVAHLNAFKPSAPDGASGTVHVAFSVDRSGRVVSVTLAGSSGDGALDQAALTMIRRASPVPAPPPELGARVRLTVPVQFH